MSSPDNTIIKKKNPTDLTETTTSSQVDLVDQLIDQINTDQGKPALCENKHVELTEEAKSKMMGLMDSYLINKEKLTKINALRKDVNNVFHAQMKELEAIMKFYGISELIKGPNKFVLDQSVRKKPIKKAAFKDVIQHVIGDTSKVDQIYETADQLSEKVVVERIKCLKHKA